MAQTERWAQVRLTGVDEEGYNYCGNGGRSWVTENSKNIDVWPSEEAAIQNGKETFKKGFKYKKNWDVVKLTDAFQASQEQYEYGKSELTDLVFSEPDKLEKRIAAIEYYRDIDIPKSALKNPDEFKKYLGKYFDLWDIYNTMEFLEDEGQEFLKDSDHKYYIVRYDDEYGWSPAEGGTEYFEGTRFTNKEGPYEYDRAQSRLKELASIFEDDELVIEKDYFVAVNEDAGKRVIYRIERDDRWGSKQTGGGGWDWSPEKNPVKHPFRGKYVVVDKETGEVVAEDRDRKELRKPAREYLEKVITEEKRIPKFELRMYNDQGSRVATTKEYDPFEAFARD